MIIMFLQAEKIRATVFDGLLLLPKGYTSTSTSGFIDDLGVFMYEEPKEVIFQFGCFILSSIYSVPC